MTDWPHSPPHRLTERGAYMVTAGTHGKAHFMNTNAKLDAFQDTFFSCIEEAGWRLHAWSILSNHYHFIASSPSDPRSLRRMISKLHTLSARELNKRDMQTGRRVWFQYFDSHLTFHNSYLARLKYVHNNPAHHGVVGSAAGYPWCSARWFNSSARPSFRKTVEGFSADRLSVEDEFAPAAVRVAEEESGVKPPHSKGVAAKEE
jgi:putative transposase